MKYHIEADIVTNWDVMKKKIMAKRERMTQIMFERDNVLDMYMVIQAVASLRFDTHDGFSDGPCR